jgi:hypothetical protein
MARADDYKAMDLFAEVQSKADAVASLFGQKAARPMAGETLAAFKRGSVNQWRDLSPTYKDVNLLVLAAADSIAFDVAVDDILACARKEGERPSRVPAGYLAERVESRNGHTYTRFYGAPKSWMAAFAPQGRVVKRINHLNERGDTDRVGYSRGDGK